MKHLIALTLGASLLAACIPDIMNTKPEVRGLEGLSGLQVSEYQVVLRGRQGGDA